MSASFASHHPALRKTECRLKKILQVLHVVLMLILLEGHAWPRITSLFHLFSYYDQRIYFLFHKAKMHFFIFFLNVFIIIYLDLHQSPLLPPPSVSCCSFVSISSLGGAGETAPASQPHPGGLWKCQDHKKWQFLQICELFCFCLFVFFIQTIRTHFSCVANPTI